MKTLAIGLGRRGGDALEKVPADDVPGLEVLYSDLDPDDLASRPEGSAVLHLGAGVSAEGLERNDMALAFRAATEQRGAIEEHVGDAELVILVAGLGGGTGAGASRAIANIVRERGVPVVALLTIPFGLEGPKRVGRGRIGLRQVRDAVDLTVPFAQDSLLHLASRYSRVRELMMVVDEFLRHAVMGIHALVTDAGIDGFRALLETCRSGAFSYGVADAPEGIVDAVRIATAGPFLDGLVLGKTRGLGVAIRSREPLDDADVGRALATVAAYTSPDAALLVSNTVDPALGNAVHVTLMPTGELGVPAARASEIWVPGPSG